MLDTGNFIVNSQIYFLQCYNISWLQSHVTFVSYFLCYDSVVIINKQTIIVFSSGASSVTQKGQLHAQRNQRRHNRRMGAAS